VKCPLPVSVIDFELSYLLLPDDAGKNSRQTGSRRQPFTLNRVVRYAALRPGWMEADRAPLRSRANSATLLNASSRHTSPNRASAGQSSCRAENTAPGKSVQSERLTPTPQTW
jgi:hypothetical protein